MDDISVVFDAINSMYKSEDRKKRKEATNYLEDFQKLVIKINQIIINILIIIIIKIIIIIIYVFNNYIL